MTGSAWEARALVDRAWAGPGPTGLSLPFKLVCSNHTRLLDDLCSAQPPAKDLHAGVCQGRCSPRPAGRLPNALATPQRKGKKERPSHHYLDQILL